MSTQRDIAIFILAGGKSTRMGQEKGLVKLKGKPMIQHVLETTAPLGESQHIIGHHPLYASYGVEVQPDLIPDLGPLGGIYTALTHCQADRALILSCDCPLIHSSTLAALIERAGAKLTVGTWQDRIYPFPGIYPKSLRPKLEATLKARELKVQSFILGQVHQLIPYENISSDPPQELLNFNTPEQLANWENNDQPC
ncbi:molybdenum cofactor guanylyltransferase [Algoriphagus namhaensis]